MKQTAINYVGNIHHAIRTKYIFNYFQLEHELMEHELVHTWKRMMIHGNQSFNTGRLYSAENYYEIACNLAYHMCLKGITSSNDLAPLLMSYQNLAELYFKKNQTNLALSQYQKLHEKLVEFSQRQQNSGSLLMVQNAIRKIGKELFDTIKKKEISSLRSKQLMERIISM